MKKFFKNFNVSYFNIFMLGMMVNAVAHRIGTGETSDIKYPILIGIFTIIQIIINKFAPRTIVNRLKDKFNLESDSYSDYRLMPATSLELSWINISEGFYGFDLGAIPSVWITVLDQFLNDVEKKFPEFKIQQIKVKFGGIRIYLEGVDEETSDLANKLGNLLYDRRLVY